MNDIILEEIDPLIIDSLDYDDELNQISDNNDLINNDIDSISTDTEDNLIAIENLYEVYIKGTNNNSLIISKEDIQSDLHTLSMNGVITNRVKSFEDNSTEIVTTEELGEVISGAIKTVGSSLGNVIKKMVDNAQANFVFIQFQNRKSASLRVRLNELKSYKSKASFNVRVTKNCRVGSEGKAVTGKDEYLKELKTASNFSTGLLRLTGKFTKDDFLSSIKTLISPATGYNDNFVKMFKSLEHLILGSIKLPSVKKINSTPESNFYMSDVLLGLSSLEIDTPLNGSYKLDNVDSLKQQYENFYMTVVRKDKFGLPIFSDHVLFKDVDVDYLIKILDTVDDTIVASREYNTLITHLSRYGTYSVFADAILTIPILAGLLIKYLLASYRLMLRSSIIIHNTSASSFNFSRGNTAKALNIVEQGIRNIELVVKSK
jgi:hypothetical protein